MYRLLQDHLETFIAVYDEKFLSQYGHLRPEVRTALEELIQCGVYRFGLARIKCKDCGDEDIIALSCQRRGLCSSCHAKRRQIFAERTLEDVLADVPYRQWTFSLPKALRPCFRFDGSLFKGLAQIVVRELTRYFRTITGHRDLDPGFVVWDQKFGSLPDTYHPHQHICATDGGFIPDGKFVRLPRVRDKDIQAVCEVLRHQVLRWLLRREKMSREFHDCLLGWEHSGFSLHVSRPIHADQRDQLERLCLYMARPAFNPKAIRYDSSDGQVRYRSSKKHRVRNTNVIEAEPVEFIAMLAQHIPHRKRHQVRFYGVASPKVRKRLGICVPEPVDRDMPAVTAARGRRSWARLIWKLYGIDPLVCIKCGGERRIIAVIVNDEVIVRILKHVGLPHEMPVLQPARGPPSSGSAAGTARIWLQVDEHVDPDFSEWDCNDVTAEEVAPASKSASPHETRTHDKMTVLEIIENVPGMMRASDLELKGKREGPNVGH